ncbi:hypothetical protein M9Y10_040236 [Tritrichomonas musculus]|uniref:Uncharacterized protein n=1 Tax=Tritrichomonas musculus TaxID=1915356 RepID=A0ABR2GQ24_9EUKA
MTVTVKFVKVVHNDRDKHAEKEPRDWRYSHEEDGHVYRQLDPFLLLDRVIFFYLKLCCEVDVESDHCEQECRAHEQQEPLERYERRVRVLAHQRNRVASDDNQRASALQHVLARAVVYLRNREGENPADLDHDAGPRQVVRAAEEDEQPRDDSWQHKRKRNEADDAVPVALVLAEHELHEEVCRWDKQERQNVCEEEREVVDEDDADRDEVFE